MLAAEASGQAASTSGRDYLAYFMHRHLDFRLAETDALLELAGHAASPARWRLPHGGLAYSPFWYLSLPSDAVARQIVGRSILLKVRPAFWLFVVAVAADGPISHTWPVMSCHACRESAQLCSMMGCVHAKGVLELWGEGETAEELQAAIEACPDDRKAPWLTAERSMKVHPVHASPA